MPEPPPLDYEPVSAPRPPRNISIFWLVPVFAVAFFVLAIALFQGGHGPEHANRARCAENLRQIGLAIRLYCNDDEQHYPSDVGLLLPTPAMSLSAETFVCPSTTDTKRTPSAQQAAKLLSAGHCSYIYVGAGMTSSAGSDEVVALELPDNHSKDGGNVLYGDHHVSWEPFETLVQLVPELEAGRNPPVIRPLTAAQAKTMYDQKWLPKLPAIKNGAWAASLPRPAPSTRPAAAPN